MIMTDMTPGTLAVVYICARMLVQRTGAPEIDPGSLLRPYITSFLALDQTTSTQSCLLELFYIERLSNVPRASSETERMAGVFVMNSSPAPTATFAETGDAAAIEATRVFWEVSEQLCKDGDVPMPGTMWTRDEASRDANDDDEW